MFASLVRTTSAAISLTAAAAAAADNVAAIDSDFTVTSAPRSTYANTLENNRSYDDSNLGQSYSVSRY